MLRVELREETESECSPRSDFLEQNAQLNRDGSWTRKLKFKSLDATRLASAFCGLIEHDYDHSLH